MNRVIRWLGAALACASLLCGQESGSFESLFDGKTLDGWTPMPGGSWDVVDGAIVGTSPRSERRHGILLSDREYADFEVRCQFRVVKGDSGFYWRAEKVKSAVSVNGFQVEVDTTQETGGLYETGGRGWVAKPGPEVREKRQYVPGAWTRLRVIAKGRDVKVYINDVLSSELKADDKVRLKGHFGLQLHGGQDMHVLYKEIEIREIAD